MKIRSEEDNEVETEEIRNQRFNSILNQQKDTIDGLVVPVIKNVLDKVGLKHNETLDKYPHQLSGGQRQRLMIARALLCKPNLSLQMSLFQW